jgi:hypothetical protein
MHLHVTTQPQHIRRQKILSPTSSLLPASILSRTETRRIVAEMLG